VSTLPPEELIEPHEAFLERLQVDRPLLGLWFGGYYPAEQFPQGTGGWADGQALRPEDVSFAPFAADYERLYDLHRAADDDFFYVASAYWGIPWLEAILGCRVIAGASSCRAEPSGDRDAGGERWLDTLLRFTRELVKYADGRFPVCAPLLRGPGDCASALLGAMRFATDCIDDPDNTRDLIERCARVRSAVLERMRDVVPTWRGTYAAGGYPSKVWSRRTVGYCQEDSAAVISPALFRRLLLPAHRSIAGATEVSFIHLHSACLYPVDMLLEGGAYTVIEVNIDHAGTGPPLSAVMPVFRRIQAAGYPLVLWGHFDQGDWDLVHRDISPVGLSLQLIIGSADDLRVAMSRR
jgi:hypothetical protein